MVNAFYEELYMPGFITHLSFGEQSLSFIESLEIKSLIETHMTTYSLGLQGPDIFFYHLPCYLFHKHNIGNIMHRYSVMLFFDNLINARNSFEDSHERRICDAYILGYIGHYCLDVTCHPYIYFKSDHFNNLKRSSVYDFGKHVSLETDIDHIVLDYYKKIKPSEFDYSAAVSPSTNERLVISKLLFSAINSTFPKDSIKQKTIRNAIEAFIKLNGKMNDPSGKKKHKLRRIEQTLFHCSFISAMIPSDTLIKYNDPCNVMHNEWHNPWYPSIPRSDSIFDLINKAMPVFMERINLYMKATGYDVINDIELDSVTETYQYIHFRNRFLSSISDISYITGLPIK